MFVRIGKNASTVATTIFDSGPNPNHSMKRGTRAAGKWETFISLELPSALPAILAGMEVGIVLAIIGAVVGEYLGGSTGLGYLAVASLNDYKTGMLFAVILLLTIIGFGLYVFISGLKRLVIPWHESVLIERQTVVG